MRRYETIAKGAEAMTDIQTFGVGSRMCSHCQRNLPSSELCGINMILHFEDDGTMELFADTGAWDINLALKATTIEAARQEAFAWADALPVEA